MSCSLTRRTDDETTLSRLSSPPIKSRNLSDRMQHKAEEEELLTSQEPRQQRTRRRVKSQCNFVDMSSATARMLNILPTCTSLSPALFIILLALSARWPDQVEAKQQQPQRQSWQQPENTQNAASTMRLISRAVARQQQDSSPTINTNEGAEGAPRSHQATSIGAATTASEQPEEAASDSATTSEAAPGPSDSFAEASPSASDDSSEATDDEGAADLAQPESDDAGPIDRRDDSDENSQQAAPAASELSPQMGPSASEQTYEGIHLRPSRHSQPTQLVRDTSSSSSASTTPTPTSSRAPPRAMVATQRPPQQQQPHTRLPFAPVTSLDVNMGADRMMIKPGDDYESRLLASAPTVLPPQRPQLQLRQASSSTTTTDTGSSTPMATTMSSIASFVPTPPASRQELGSQNFQPSHELATESVNHYHHVPTVQETPDTSQRQSAPNEHRQDLLYPTTTTTTSNQDLQQQQFQSRSSQQQSQFMGDSFQQQQAQDSPLTVASICYTPLSLMLIISLTILITLFVCLCTYYLLQKRRNHFDLVTNSKHFDHKHSTTAAGHLQGAPSLGQGGTLGTAAAFASVATFGSHHNSFSRPSQTRREQSAQKAAAPCNSKAGACCTMHLFRPDERCDKCRTVGGLVVSSEPAGANVSSSYAFKNPYFTDERVVSDAATAQDSPSAVSRLLESTDGKGTFSSQSALSPADAASKFDFNTSAAAGLLRTASSSEQMHFIESHIANLHSRQVTSSVKELSLGDMTTAPQVVDLTSAEQQARVRLNPKEGDLVAVDISGHDIIGLGFDVCGNQRDGIFIRSVSSHGPASESGCMQAGDRIKCLNINFENMTLRDACDILNCGAPYKLRLLIEKKIATGRELTRMQQQASLRPASLALAGGKRFSRTQPNSMLMQQQQVLDTRPQERGRLEMAGAYIKHLTNKLMGHNDQRLEQQQRLRSYDPYRMAPTAMTLASNPLLMLSHYQAPLGSAAARERTSGDGGMLGEDDRDTAPAQLGNGFAMLGLGIANRQDHEHDQVSLGEGETTTATSGIGVGGRGDERNMSRRSSALTTSEQQRVSSSAAAGHKDPTAPRHHQGHRRRESYHINAAFNVDDELDRHQSRSPNHERQQQAKDGQGKRLANANSDMMQDALASRPASYNKRTRNDDEQEVEELPHNSQSGAMALCAHERQSKLMASGETLNSKSRLTM